MTHESQAVRRLAPEDIRIGDCIIVVQERWQVLDRCDELSGPRIRLLELLPSEPSVLRVVSICLPFVAVQHRDRKTEILDVRRVSVGRVSRGFELVAGSIRHAKKDDD